MRPLPKPPPNIPHIVGDRVRLRANTARTGVVKEVTPRMWFLVDWDDGLNRPKIVHQYELMIDGKVESARGLD